MNEFPRVKVINPGYSWFGTECYIDGKKIDRIKRVDFSVGVDEVPTFEFETVGFPDIDMPGRIILDCTPVNVIEAVKILRDELLKHGDLYDGFSASISSALKEHWCCGLPFEPEDEMARKILDYVIGNEE